MGGKIVRKACLDEKTLKRERLWVSEVPRRKIIIRVTVRGTETVKGLQSKPLEVAKRTARQSTFFAFVRLAAH